MHTKFLLFHYHKNALYFKSITAFRCSKAYSIVEVLIAMAVLLILVGLAMVAMHGILDRRDAIVCLVHIRELGSMVTLYTQDNRDYFPSWIRGGVAYQPGSEHWRDYQYQMFGTMEHENWLTYAGLQSSSQILYCSANYWRPDMYQNIAAPDYVLSSSMYISPTYLNPHQAATHAPPHLAGKVQRISMTSFPSAKVGMFEMFVWHGWRGDRDHGEVGTLEYWQSSMPGSVWFLDGHVRQVNEYDGVRPVNRSPVWPLTTFGTTPWGMQGRDIQ
jgi:type II secretory pathway pseudopilin PulG